MTAPPTRAPHARNEAACVVAVGAALAMAVAIYLAEPLSLLGAKVSFSYNEGWNAYFAARSGVALYPAPETLTFNNYPPLSFLVVGALSPLFGGDAILAGRVVALVAMLWTICAMGWAAARLTSSARAGVIAALIVLATLSGQYQIYVALNDPQWLGHAFMATAAVILAGRPVRLAPLAAAGALMILGGLVKHLLIALPLATAAWLAIYDRAAFLRFAAASAALLVAALILLFLAFGPPLFAAVLGHQRVLSPGFFLLGLAGLAPLAPILIPAAAAFFSPAQRRAPAGLFAIAALFALAVALLARSGEGVDVNAYFDLVLYATPAAVAFLWPMLADATADRKLRLAGAALGALLLVPALSPAPMRLAELKSFLEERGRLVAEADAMIAAIRATPGDVVCMRLAYCYWAQEPFHLDMFNAGQAAMSSEALRRRFDARFAEDFAAVQIDAAPPPSRALQATTRRFAPAEVFGAAGVLYRPADRPKAGFADAPVSP